MLRILTTGVLLMLIVTGCGKEQENSMTPSKAAVKNHIEVSGTVNAYEIKNYKIDFPAIIEKIHVRNGQRVKIGEPLITLNMSEFGTEISNKEKELRTSKFELQKSSDTTELKKLSDNLKYAEEMYKKIENLYKDGAISQYNMDEYSNSLEGRRKNVEEIKLSILSYENQRDYNLKIQKEKTSELESELKMLKDKLNKSYLKNNVITCDTQKGVVFDVSLLPGDSIGKNEKIISLINLDSIFVQAEVPEEFLKDIRLGAQAVIIPVSDKLKKYTGRVSRISNNAIQQNGETIILVEIEIDGIDDFLLYGLNVNVEIYNEAINVPAS